MVGAKRVRVLVARLRVSKGLLLVGARMRMVLVLVSCSIGSVVLSPEERDGCER